MTATAWVESLCAATGEPRDAVAAFVQAGQAAWPDLQPGVDVMAELLRVGGRDLASVDPGEAWLAAACVDGDRKALAAMERLVQGLDPVLASKGLDRAKIEDIRQQVLGRLLTAGEDGVVPLLKYAGDGKLHGLVKTVGIRIAVDELRKDQVRPPTAGPAELEVDRMVRSGGLGPELEVAEAEHRAQVKAAFEAAIATLDSKQRALLRLHVLEDATIDDIAALHDVHRATAARWLVRIREVIAEETHRILRKTIAAAGGDRQLESLLRSVDSRIDLSLSRALAAEDA